MERATSSEKCVATMEPGEFPWVHVYSVLVVLDRSPSVPPYLLHNTNPFPAKTRLHCTVRSTRAAQCRLDCLIHQGHKGGIGLPYARDSRLFDELMHLFRLILLQPAFITPPAIVP